MRAIILSTYWSTNVANLKPLIKEPRGFKDAKLRKGHPEMVFDATQCTSYQKKAISAI